MNGIEALQALKDGKVLVHEIHGSKRYLCYHSIFIQSFPGDHKCIWYRYEDEWMWNHMSNCNVLEWMESDGYEIAEDVMI